MPASASSIIVRLLRRLSGAEEPQKLLKRILDAAAQITRADTGSIILIDRRTSSLSIEAARGFADRVVAETRLGIGEGITGWVAKHGRTLRVDDVTKDRRYVPLNKTIRSELAAPLLLEREVIGVINVDSTRKSAFTAEDAEAIETLAGLSSRVIADALIHDRLRRRSLQFETLVRIAGEINSTMSLERILEEVACSAVALLDAKMAVVRLRDATGERLEIAAVYGASARYHAEPPMPVEGSALGEVLTTRRPLLLEDVLRDRRFRAKQMARDEGLRSMIAVPLVAGIDAVGTLAVYHAREAGLTADSVTIAEGLGGLAAVAIQNARLFRNVIEADERIRKEQWRSAAGAMSAEIAHEIRNPITVARLLVGGRAGGKAEPLAEHDRKVVLRELDRVDAMIARLLAAGTERTVPFERVDLRALLEKILVVARVKAASRNIAIRISGHALAARGRPDDLRQVFANIIDNALDAARSRIAIRLRRRRVAPGRGAMIEVLIEDDGPGVPKGTPIYEPMVTTKETGVGVGLFAVRRIILEHGGEITHARSRALGGALFRVVIPAEEDRTK